MKILYVSDLDGTLLNRDATLSETTTRIINALQERGMHFTFATARSMKSASIAIKGLQLHTPIIIYNGVFLIDPQTHKPLYANYFTKEKAHAILDALLSKGQYPLVYAMVDGEECVHYCAHKLHAGGLHYVEKRKSDKRFREIKTIEDYYKGDIFYITCIDEEEKLQPIQDVLHKDDEIRTVFYQELYRDEFWLESMPADVSKAHALAKLKEIQGYDRIICFGDAPNDIPMFLLSDECYAMQDALQELKDVATDVIGSNDEDAVAHWLEKNAIINMI